MIQERFIGDPVPVGKRRKTRKADAVGCETCTLNDRLSYRCDSFGDPKSHIWWVGEAPGKNEAEAHQPFVGVSGQFHWEQVYNTLGLPKHKMYTGNAARCWPENNRTPTGTEVKHCLPYLEAEIRQHHPVVIGALGATPFHALTGRKEPISEVVGQEFIRKDGVKVIPLYHPSYLLRLGKPESLVELYRMHLRRVLAASKSRSRTDFARAAGYKVERLDERQWCQYMEYIVHKVGWCSIDLETKEGRVPYLISSAYGTKRGFVAYWEEVQHWLTRFFMTDPVGFVFQNGAGFDIPVIEKYAKCTVKNYLWDTFIAGVTIDSRKGRNNLTRLTEWAVPDLAGYDGEVNRLVDALDCKDDYSKIPPEVLIPYAGYDAIATALIMQKQKAIANDSLVKFYMELCREVLYPLEQLGLNVDQTYLVQMVAYLQKEIEHTREKIATIAGKDFNPGSNAQVASLLFSRLKLPLHGIRVSKKTQVPAVDRETFSKLSGKHPVIDHIQKLRSDEKSFSTYAKRVKDQLVHGRFHVKYWIGGASKEDEERGAETGRLSSTLQNIPRVDKDNPRKFEPADIFMPDKGMVFLVPDYSQAELRMVAILAHERGMIADFKNGIDAHTGVCHRYLDVPLGEKPSKSVRVRAKGINFAKIFGAGVKKLAQQIGCSIQEIYNLFQRDHAAYPNYWRWRKWQIEKAARDRCVYTLFGFRRPLDIPDHWEYKELELEHWMKQALNTPVQGSAAQIMLLAMLIIKRMNLPAQLLMNMHDSAPMQVHPRHLDKVAERVKYAMEVAVVDEVMTRFKKDISVLPWVAELEYGERISSLKPLQ